MLGEVIVKPKAIFFFIFLVILSGCDSYNSNPTEQRRREIAHEKFVAEEFAKAAKQANNNNPAGFLKLYEIATDDNKYSVEYSEVAIAELNELLYSRTPVWINTFSRVEPTKFKEYFKNTVGVMDLPKGVANYEQLRNELIIRLKKIKGDDKEKDLIAFIIDQYSQAKFEE